MQWSRRNLYDRVVSNLSILLPGDYPFSERRPMISRLIDVSFFFGNKWRRKCFRKMIERRRTRAAKKRLNTPLQTERRRAIFFFWGGGRFGVTYVQAGRHVNADTKTVTASRHSIAVTRELARTTSSDREQFDCGTKIARVHWTRHKFKRYRNEIISHHTAIPFVGVSFSLW